MKKDKITKEEAMNELKALGLTEEDAAGVIKINLPGIVAARKRQAIDAVLNRIDEEGGEK